MREFCAPSPHWTFDIVRVRKIGEDVKKEWVTIGHPLLFAIFTIKVITCTDQSWPGTWGS